MAKPSDKPQLVWETLNSVRLPKKVFQDDYDTHRAKVSGGWLVSIHHGFGSGLTFYADPDHRWDGGSLS
jgi:hypothetical protein